MTLSALGAVLIPFLVTLPRALLYVWPVLVYQLAFAVCIVNHNHQHRPIFRLALLNSLFQVLMTLAKGHTSSTVIVPHMYNHHRLNGMAGDWIAVAFAGEGRGALRLLRYVWTASRTMARERRKAGAPKLARSKQRQLIFERSVLIVFVAALGLSDPLLLLFVVALPWALAIVSLVGINLLQHDGCDASSRYNHSRNFTSKVGNWLLFNNGYHTIHHNRPALHWSVLPEAHAREVAPFIDRALVERSVIVFLLRHYLVTSTRPLPGWAATPITAQGQDR